MAGQVIELLPRTELDFSFLAVGATQTRVLVGNIPTADWTKGTLIDGRNRSGRDQRRPRAEGRLK